MTVTDAAISRIKAMIVSGEIKPGDRLPPEQELAKRLGLSRSSMREAVKALEVIRVLDVRRGDGSYVTSLEPKLLLEAVSFVVEMHDDHSLLEIFAVRRILESAATALAAVQRTAFAIQELRDELLVGKASKTLDQLVQHDSRFHLAIVRIGGNDYLTSLIESLTTQTIRARVWRGITEEGAVSKTLAEHEGIVEAIESGDPVLASALATAHVAGVERWLAKTLSG